jgi:hypothetical protein
MISLPNRKALPALLALLLIILSVAGCNNFFTDPKLTAISVTPASSSIASAAPGNTVQLTATGTYDDNSTKDVTGSATWSFSSSTLPGIATLSHGLVTGLKNGTVTAQASSGGQQGTATVAVGVTLVSIVVTPGNLTLSKASSPPQQYTATGTYSDSSTLDITTSVVWSSSPSGVVTFSTTTQGLATLVATGTTTITATSGSVNGNTSLTVN